MDSEELYAAVSRLKETAPDVLHVRIEAAPAVIRTIATEDLDLMKDPVRKTTSLAFSPKTCYFEFHQAANEALYLGGIATRELVEVYFSDDASLLTGRLVYDLYAITADIRLRGIVTPEMSSLLRSLAPGPEELDQLGIRVVSEQAA